MLSSAPSQRLVSLSRRVDGIVTFATGTNYVVARTPLDGVVNRHHRYGIVVAAAMIVVVAVATKNLLSSPNHPRDSHLHSPRWYRWAETTVVVSCAVTAQ